MQKKEKDLPGKKMAKRLKQILFAGLLMVGLGTVGMSMPVKAANSAFDEKIVALKAKFPEGKYWNHVGSTKDNPDGWTEKACSCHEVADCVYGTGGCTCNHHVDSGHLLATQCMGFANKLGYDVFGDTTWTKVYSPSKAQIAQITVGDIVRINGHSVFIIARNGTQVTVGEANYSGKCKISWTRAFNISIASIEYYEHASNYDKVLNGGTVQVVTTAATTQSSTGNQMTEEGTTQLGTTGDVGGAGSGITTEEPATLFTGWKKAADKVHYQYFKDGVALKNQWLVIKSRKYYLDENGYRVTGIYQVGSMQYYFNNTGRMQKKLWFTIDNEVYYVDGNGYLLKSQWLVKDGVYVYMTVDGSMAQSELVKIGSATYYFDAEGKRSKGFKKCNGKYYYCNATGIIQRSKWIKRSGKQFYIRKNGVRAQSVLLKIGGYKYYFNAKGYLQISTKFVYKGKIYSANKKGRCKLVGTQVTTEQTTQSTTN